jgi:hypothetical protein
VATIAGQSGKRNFPDEAAALDAGVIDEDVDLARLRVNR